MDYIGLQTLADSLWVVTKPFKFPIGDIGSRMTVVRLADGRLLLHSPVKLDHGLHRELDRLGQVAWIVGPSLAHHLALGDYQQAWPQASLCGAPGLARKRPDLRFDYTLAPDGQAPWGDELPYFFIAGMPRLNEVALLHRPSRTLILTDLTFNVKHGPDNHARFFHFVVGATDHFGPHRLIRGAIEDKSAAQKSVTEMLSLDFDRIVLSHGQILEHGGKQALRDAFAFLLENRHSS